MNCEQSLMQLVEKGHSFFDGDMTGRLSSYDEDEMLDMLDEALNGLSEGERIAFFSGLLGQSGDTDDINPNSINGHLANLIWNQGRWSGMKDEESFQTEQK